MKKAGQNKVFCPVIIRKPSKITPDDKSMTIKKGKKRKISYELPQGSTSSKITFSSSNKKIATVSSAGVVKAKKKGKHLGRPFIQKPSNYSQIMEMWKANEITTIEASRRLGVSKTTFYQMLKRDEAKCTKK
jgi:hypothetical protein